MIRIPSYAITPAMLQELARIDSLSLLLAEKEIPHPLHDTIKRRSILKSSVFSARIEGNTLTEQTADASSDIRQKQEVFNILDAVKKLPTLIKKNHGITLSTIKQLHALVMKELTADAGHLRHEHNAIFNSAGAVVYQPPPPTHVVPLLEMLINYIQTTKDFPLIVAAIAHLVFEEIHPFIDGNGRVGRLLFIAVLQTRRYQVPHVPFEEYLDTNRDLYYYHLQHARRDIEAYLLFMLEAFYTKLNDIYKEVTAALSNKISVYLPARQEEIYQIIIEHPFITFDGIWRRFLQVPERTLRYDITKLVEKGLVQKQGSTKGTTYMAKND